MGIPIKPSKVKLFFGLISNDENLFLETEKVISKKFGPLDFSSKIFPFNYTSYYDNELGTGLKRKFVSCKKLIQPEFLSEIKIFTNRLEIKSSYFGKRRINIDPGYLSPGKVILATTKDYSHRIYLNKGIYAEVTLSYEKNSFRPGKMTYPDYKTEVYIEIFNHLYKIYLGQLKCEK